VLKDHWTGTGPEFFLNWGGRAWRLSLDEPNPGLASEAGPHAVKLLALEGLSRTGKVDRAAFTKETLIALEKHRGAVVATFAPAGWGGLKVRAGWRPTIAGDSVDLEIQLSASSVGELDSVQVDVRSNHGDPTGGRRLETESNPGRDILLSPELAEETTSSASDDHRQATVDSSGEPSRFLSGLHVLTPAGSPAGWFYLEMNRPGDIAARCSRDRQEPASTRYALFGHDLERGVILRARLRGCWIHANAPELGERGVYADFLAEPPSLSP
jgi:hypothetical protein